MKTKIAATLFCVSLMGSAQAQVNKCIGPGGKVTFSDVACSTASKTIQTTHPSAPDGYQPRPSATAPLGNVYEREISGKIRSYLLQNDFEHAATLAVTTEHFQMIAQAKREYQNHELDKKAAAQAARPTVCKTYGASSGVATHLSGGLTVYNGVNRGKTVCNK